MVSQIQTPADGDESRADLLREAIVARYGEDTVREHFADTSDTLCYATKENQDATYALIQDGADLAIVVGGYNSSNTPHLVEIGQEVLTTPGSRRT